MRMTEPIARNLAAALIQEPTVRTVRIIRQTSAYDVMVELATGRTYYYDDIIDGQRLLHELRGAREWTA